MSILPPTRAPISLHRPSTCCTSANALGHPSKPSWRRIQTMSPRVLQRPSPKPPPSYFLSLLSAAAQSSTSASIAPLGTAKQTRNAPPVKTGTPTARNGVITNAPSRWPRPLEITRSIHKEGPFIATSTKNSSALTAMTFSRLRALIWPWPPTNSLTSRRR